MLNEEQRLAAVSKLSYMHFEDPTYTPSPCNVPYASCQSYAIVDGFNGKLLFQHHGEEMREMASLTKIMTAFVSISLAEELKIDMKKTYFYVSKYAAKTTGTTASLIEGQCLAVWDLLRGLMLPSGNDAANCLAENFGDRIRNFRRPGELRKTFIV